MLKRKFGLILVMIMMIVLTPKKVLANGHCTSSSSLSGCNTTGAMCRDNGFNCDNKLVLSQDECIAKGGCFEEKICTSGLVVVNNEYCYLPATATKTPDECGYIGKVCCNVDGNNVCTHSGVPTTANYNCICQESGSSDQVKSYNPLCDLSGTSNPGISSALGCIPIEMNNFIPWILSWLFGIAGGIAFLLMAYGFILIATSSGDEKKVQGAKETITSAIVGLLVCIFAVFILRLIAVNILKIPGI